MTLRSKLIRLAHQNPELRPHILPILREKQAAYMPIRLLATAKDLATMGTEAPVTSTLHSLYALHLELSALYVVLNRRPEIRGMVRDILVKNQRTADAIQELYESLLTMGQISEPAL
jgi:hypothetical protein